MLLLMSLFKSFGKKLGRRNEKRKICCMLELSCYGNECVYTPKRERDLINFQWNFASRMKWGLTLNRKLIEWKWMAHTRKIFSLFMCARWTVFSKLFQLFILKKGSTYNWIDDKKKEELAGERSISQRERRLANFFEHDENWFCSASARNDTRGRSECIKKKVESWQLSKFSALFLHCTAMKI